MSCLRFALFAGLTATLAAACDGPVGPAGADGATGADGVEGPQGEPGADGWVPNKDDLYEIQEFGNAPAPGYFTLDASCLDENDVLLTGGCDLAGAADFAYLSVDREFDAADPAAVSYWRCKVGNFSDGSILVAAMAVCVDVP